MVLQPPSGHKLAVKSKLQIDFEMPEYYRALIFNAVFCKVYFHMHIMIRVAQADMYVRLRWVPLGVSLNLSCRKGLEMMP